MKSWLTKFRISDALDSGRPLPESMRRQIAADPDLSHFAHQSELLAQTKPETPADSDLHHSIMRAVSASSRRPERSRPTPALSWLTASATLAAIVVVTLCVDRPAPTPVYPSMGDPLAVLQMSEEASAKVPAVVMAPLSHELALVNHDVQDTTQILLSSFPF